MKSVNFEVGGQKVSGHFFYPDAPKAKNPAILLIHGWTSGQDRLYGQAEELAKLGYICMTFDLRGHGESEGDIKVQTRQDFLDDVLAAYDLLAKDDLVTADNITAIGSSFGSYLGDLLSSHRNINKLIMRVPANYPDGDPSETIYKYADTYELMEWRKQPKNYDEVESLKYLHDFRGNILIVESGEDEVVPHQTIQNYLDAVNDKSKLRHIVMEGAPHSITDFPELKKEFNKIVINWLKDNA